MKLPKIYSHKNNAQGFTILELLVSMSVFSVALLVFSAGSAQIGRMFHKGIIASRTQETARTVIEEIGKSIQFSSGQIQQSTGFFCIGGTHYIYEINKQVKGNDHALRRVQTSESAPCNDTTGEELLQENMRLTDFSINCNAVSQICDLSVGVAYGDDDLLENTPPNTRCKGGVVGSQFCAVSNLKTSVTRRVQ